MRNTATDMVTSVGNLPICAAASATIPSFHTVCGRSDEASQPAMAQISPTANGVRASRNPGTTWLRRFTAIPYCSDLLGYVGHATSVATERSALQNLCV